LFYPALPPSSLTNPNSPFPSSFIVFFPILLSAHVDLFFLLALFFFLLFCLYVILFSSCLCIYSLCFISILPPFPFLCSIYNHLFCFPFFFLFFFFPFLFTTLPSPPCVCLLVHFSLLKSSLSRINAACSLFFAVSPSLYIVIMITIMIVCHLPSAML
jgi:hypothetical protein